MAQIDDSVSEDLTVFHRITDFLQSNQISYKHTHHEPTKTSEESARVRGVTLASGAKAMLIHPAKKLHDKEYILVVLSAEKKLDWTKLRRIYGRKTNFVAKDKIATISGCVSGAVPPFGSKLHQGDDIFTLVDITLIDQGDTINFNAGTRTDSINMYTRDFLALESHEIINVACEES